MSQTIKYTDFGCSELISKDKKITVKTGEIDWNDVNATVEKWRAVSDKERLKTYLRNEKIEADHEQGGPNW